MQLLLITDLDNTLVGDDRATRRLNAKIQQRRDSGHNSVCLVYATGRSLAATAALMQERPMLVPDLLITGVGTGIYHCDPTNTAPEQLASAARLDPQWSQQLSGNWDRAAIAGLMQNFPMFQPQSASEQNPWKLSFWLDSEATATKAPGLEAPGIIANLEAALDQLGLSTQIVFSSGQDLDIVPRAANKGNAVAYLQQQFAGTKAVVCGDSGNDISLFEQSELGIIVENAQPELHSWYQRQGKQGHYLAKSPFAWGILEGLQYLRLL